MNELRFSEYFSRNNIIIYNQYLTILLVCLKFIIIFIIFTYIYIYILFFDYLSMYKYYFNDLKKYTGEKNMYKTSETHR